MASLFQVLPELVGDIENALIRIGRGDIADQLREVELERWTYDDFANVVNLYLKSPRTLNVVDQRNVGLRRGETLCPSDDIAVNLELDNQRRLIAIELLDAGSTVAKLEKFIAV